MRLSGARTELLLNDEWVDITGYVLERDPISITRGRSSDAATSDPSKCTLTLNNRDGRFSPRNPMSPYFGVLGRNTPLRVSLAHPDGTAFQVRGYNDRVQVDDDSSLDITGDIDVRVELDAIDWWSSGDFMGKWHYAFDDPLGASWALITSTKGELWLLWRDITNTELGLPSTERLPIPFGRLAVRATLDVDNGSGGYTLRYYTAETIAGPWTQLGADIVGTATTSIANTPGDFRIGTLFGGDHAVSGRYYAAQVLDGINGTPIIDIDFTAVSPGASSFVDGAGNTVNVLEGEITDRDYRFVGEVAEWPQSWDITGTDRTVKLSAFGLRRRLSLNPPSLHSAMTREFSNPQREHIMAYWPLEDASGATAVAGLGGKSVPGRIQGSPELASYANFTASDPLPVMQTGTFVLPIQPFEPTGQVCTYNFLYVPNPGPSSTASLLHLTFSNGMVWQVNLKPDGECEIQAYDNDENQLISHTTNNFGLKNRGFVNMFLELVQDGSNIDYRLLIEDFGNNDTIYENFSRVWWAGDAPGDLTVPTQLVIGRNGGLGPTILGHVAVADDINAYRGAAFSIKAWNGESPLNRMIRLCREEEGITFRVNQLNDEPVRPLMGDQLSRPFIDLISECEASDGGILYEPRTDIGLAYRKRNWLTGRFPKVTLDYGAGEIAGQLNPVDDDSALVNEASVSRIDGSNVTLEASEGSLTPEKVGRYTESLSLSLTNDSYLTEIASWRLHLGTTDEARYPYLSVNLHSPRVSDELAHAVRSLDIGDRIDITGLTGLGLPPEDSRQMVLGYREDITLVTHTVEFNLVPYRPWMAAILDWADDDDSEMNRVASDGSTLEKEASPTETSLSVLSSDIVWTTDSADLPFDVLIAGERVTVTAVSGSSSPQVFTVVRGVNGISKTLPAGSDVQVVQVPTAP